MLLNLIELLSGISITLDYIEQDLFGFQTNHSKRVAYMSNNIGSELLFTPEELYDLTSLALLHDNGASLALLHHRNRGDVKETRELMETAREHCTLGEENVQCYPFFTPIQNVILYHHENYDGSGLFGVSGEDIPLMSQIIAVADQIERKFDLSVPDNLIQRSSMISFLDESKGSLFSERIVGSFIKILEKESFWSEITNSSINENLYKQIQNYFFECDYESIRNLTKIFSCIIDAKSKYTQSHSQQVSIIMEKMLDFYKIEKDEKSKMLIASDLHDLGKLGVSNHILEKPSRLTDDEFDSIKLHPMIGANCVNQVSGFEEISVWILNHHEKLDGSGYPGGLKEEQLCFQSKLLACVDIFEALMEDRPYRPHFTMDQAFEVLFEMASRNMIDTQICKDIYTVFK